MALSSTRVRRVDGAFEHQPSRRTAVPPAATPIGDGAIPGLDAASVRPQLAAGAYSRALIAAQESERRRLARDLHDVIGQVLTAVRIDLQAASREVALAPGRLEASLVLLDAALRQVRAFALELRPSVLDDVGLVAAIRVALARHAREARFTTDLSADPGLGRLDPEIETAGYRIVQEALTNIVRHARARHVSILLRATGQVFEITVTDDGRGFSLPDVWAPGRTGACLGLVGMHERAALLGGSLDIAAAIGHGTSVVARLPLPAGLAR